MTDTEVLAELEALGTEQNRKIYRRHESGDRVFGVSFANLGQLKKKIKTDHKLAQKLWESGYFEARLLATMIADPQQADESLIDRWVADLNGHTVADYFASFAGKTVYARQRMEQWLATEDEWARRAGWSMLNNLTRDDKELPDSYFEKYLPLIEQHIHTSPNRIKQAMNNAVIAIGVRNEALQEKAEAAARRIGKVEVDHGETDCKTPDAIAYIRKTVAHYQAKAEKQKMVKTP
jgi:3-methyladenine DNA glycosylase AlkD